MHSTEIKRIKNQLVEMTTRAPAYRAVFWTLAKRSRALKESSVDALFLAVQRDFNPDAVDVKKVKKDLHGLVGFARNFLRKEHVDKLSSIYDEILTKYCKFINVSADKQYVSKKDLISFFSELATMGIGNLSKDKSRFSWTLISSIAVGRMALLENYENEVSNTDSEIVVDLGDGRQCSIIFPYEKEGRKWTHFLKGIKNWVNNELSEL